LDIPDTCVEEIRDSVANSFFCGLRQTTTRTPGVGGESHSGCLLAMSALGGISRTCSEEERE